MGQSCPERPKRGTKQHKGWPITSASGAPSCGLEPSHPGFLAKDYPGKMLGTTWSRFDLGGGGGGSLDPVWPYGEALALASSHP
jgi:hypothetical protein